MSEGVRLSDDDWLERACRILDEEYGPVDTGKWTPDTAINVHLDFDEEEINEAIWAVDPEQAVRCEMIKADVYMPVEPDIAGWLIVLAFGSVAMAVYVFLDGIFPPWASMLSSFALFIGLCSTWAYWNYPRTLERYREKYRPLTLRDLLAYRGRAGSAE